MKDALTELRPDHPDFQVIVGLLKPIDAMNAQEPEECEVAMIEEFARLGVDFSSVLYIAVQRGALICEGDTIDLDGAKVLAIDSDSLNGAVGSWLEAFMVGCAYMQAKAG